MNEDFEKLKTKFEETPSGEVLNLLVSEHEYLGEKGDSDNSNILHLINDGEKEGYIDFIRGVVVFFEPNAIIRIENEVIKLIE